LVAVAVLVAVASWWLWQRGPVVPAAVASTAPLVRTLQFSARVATASRVEVGSTLTGRVLEVAVAEGALVKAGDVLVRLESDELRAALAQSQASERQAAARLAGLRSTGRSAAQAGVAQASRCWWPRRPSCSARRTWWPRASQPGAAGRGAPRGGGGAGATGRRPRAERRQRRAGHRRRPGPGAAGAGQRGPRRRRGAAGRGVLTAPADARVLSRLVEPGQIVQPGRALLGLALAGPLQLVAQVDERYLGQLQPGQTAGVLADAYPTQRFAARVLSIAPLVDAQRGAIEVKFSLPQPTPAFLREDMTLSVEVETARREQALVVPTDALRGDESTGPASGSRATGASRPARCAWGCARSTPPRSSKA
jgi:HlyD family secretion protein